MYKMYECSLPEMGFQTGIWVCNFLSNGNGKGQDFFKKTGKNNEIKIGDLRVSICNSSSANFTITDK